MHTRVLSIAFRLLVFCFAVLTLGHSALAQLPTATILGTIKDTSGASVPGAMMTATDTQTGIARTTVSGSDGAYRFDNLPVDTYEVKAEHAGFQTQVQASLTLSVSEEAVVNFSMQVGSVQQTVTVTAEAPQVNSTSAVLGGLVSEEKITDLPLNGRNYIDLTLLQPGVIKNSGVGTGSGMAGTWISSDGAPIRANNYLLDSTQMVNAYGGTGASISGNTLGVEGIREYKVLTSSYGAEYGMMMGSQTVMVSKSGTNEWHGDGFEYLRNSAISARNFFDTSATSGGHRLPEFRRNNFGGSGGGPIKKDKVFVFAAYEGLRQVAGASPSSTTLAPGCHGAANTVITIAACPQLTGSGFTSATVSPITANLLTVYPTPTNLTTNQYGFPQAVPDDEDYGLARADYNISEKDKLFGRFVATNANITNQVPFGFLTSPGLSRQLSAVVSEDHIISSTILNSARISYSRSTIQFFQGDNFSGPGYTFIPGTSYPLGGITVTGLTTIPGANPDRLSQNLYSLGDDVFVTHGRHSIKFGALVNEDRLNVQLQNSLWGSVTFPNIYDLITAQPSTYTALNPAGDFFRNWLMYTLGFYTQDDIRLNSRLTLNLGLRYEFTTQVHEVHGRSSAIPNLLTNTAVTVGVPYKRPTPDNFSPRLGFAWDVFGDGKTAVRGGVALLYDMETNLGNDYNSLATGTPPFSSQVTVAYPNSVPFTIPFALPQTAATTGLRLFQYDFHQPKIITDSLTVEHQLPWGIAATLSYAGSKGYNLVQVQEGNPAPPNGIPSANGTACTTALPTGTAPNLTDLFDGPGATACWTTNATPPRRNTHFGTIQFFQPEGNSYYNSLQFSLVKRITHGLQFQSSYTYGHLIDDRNGMSGVDGGTNGNLTGEVPLKPILDRGNSDYDLRQLYRFNLLYNLPKFSAENGAVGKFVNGWWMSGIFSAQTGFPFNVVLGSNRSRSLNAGGAAGIDRPDYAPGRTPYNITHGVSTANGVDPCPTAGHQLGTQALFFDPCAFLIPSLGYLGDVGRNAFTGPGLQNLDVSLVKDTHFTSREGLVLEFRTEVFNLFNRPNFAPPSTTAYASSNTSLSTVGTPPSNAGLISATAASARQIQFALKLIF